MKWRSILIKETMLSYNNKDRSLLICIIILMILYHSLGNTCKKVCVINEARLDQNIIHELKEQKWHLTNRIFTKKLAAGSILAIWQYFFISTQVQGLNTWSRP